MDLSDLPLPPGPFDGRDALATALRIGIAQARRELLWLDRDLSDWPIEEPAVSATLVRLLGRVRGGASLRVLVRDERWLAQHAPRFAAMRRRAAAPIEVRRLPEGLERVDGGLLVADRRHLVERFHSDRHRGRLWVEAPAEAQPAANRFDALWNEASPCLPATTLGL